AHEAGELLGQPLHLGEPAHGIARTRKGVGLGHGTPVGCGNRCTVQTVARCKQPVAPYMNCDVADVGVTLTGSAILGRVPPDPPERNPSPTVSAPSDDLRERLGALTLQDEHRLPRRLGRVRRTPAPPAPGIPGRGPAGATAGRPRPSRRRPAWPAAARRCRWSPIRTSCRSAG